MRSRLHLAAVSAGLSAALPLAALWVAEQVVRASSCRGWACLGDALVVLAAALPVVWVLWAVTLSVLGQRFAWLVPLGATVSAYGLAGVLPALPGAAAVRGLPLLVLCAAGWAAGLGPRPVRGYGDLRRR